MFCVLPQNNQLFFKSKIMCILKQSIQGTHNGIRILLGLVVFKVWIKTVYKNVSFLDQLLKNHLTYNNSNTIFVFIGQYPILLDA